MRMLCQINRKARWDMIKNDIIKQRVEVTPIVKNIEENSLTGFGMQKEDCKCCSTKSRSSTKSKDVEEYLKKTIRETLRKYLEVNELHLNIVQD